MPTGRGANSVEWNRRHWTDEYGWQDAGEEWSKTFGNSRAQWYLTILPRIADFLPSETILEIAPGHGRWTRFLLSECRRFIGVDLAENCIAHCRERFAKAGHAGFHVNDGRSLEMAETDSVDFLFSYDSLVHANAAVMEAYAREILRVLKPDGVAFIHHSNLAQVLVDGTMPEKRHGRAQDVSAASFAQAVAEAGGQVLRQEVHDWGATGTLIDCVSTIAGPASTLARQGLLENPNFPQEAARARLLQPVYFAD